MWTTAGIVGLLWRESGSDGLPDGWGAPAPSASPTVDPDPELLLDPVLTAPGRVVLPMPRKGQAVVAVMPQDGLAEPHVLAASGGNAPVPIASVTKVMTAYIILRDHPLVAGQSGPQITVTAAEAGAFGRQRAEQQSLVKLRAGQRLTQRQALQALLIASANNVAQILARWDAGSSAAFVAKMNETARDLGMSKTRFTDPSGLDESTVSTASDLLRLAAASLAVPELIDIAGMKRATIPGAGTITNYNTLLGRRGVFGIKTGSTTAAGGCLMFAADRPVKGGGRVVVVGAVLGQPGNLTTMLTEVMDVTNRLVVSASASLRMWNPVRDGETVAEISLPDSLGSPARHRLVVPEAPSVLAWPGLRVTTQVEGLASVPSGGEATLRIRGDGVDLTLPLLLEGP
jgi:D-alanyl-D-alanine carboxypeptidase (penicillin-binding protein 5/6)